MLNELVDYCDMSYKNSETTCRCENCNNNCHGSCEKCLDKIHFGDTRRYNCFNITNYYFCKYIYKYSSEIEHVFMKFNILNSIEKLNVLSIGCGPCTDLMGIINTISKVNPNIKLDYTGVDLNDIWNHIHEHIQQNNNDNIQTRFIYDDVFNILNGEDEGIEFNVLVLQYVVSDMVKYDLDGTSTFDFIDKLVDCIIKHMEKGSIIIMNDINYMTTRKYFDYMLTKLNSHYEYACCHFNNNYRDNHFDYGEEYNSNELTTIIPTNILEDYNPWQFCSSAQMIVRKKE
ncbi:hypothetical protein C1H57_17355 [Clostridium sp. 2-1]|uniref:hypothetical protein n=1 Tax=Clostridium TaxID=1485 RepID=UPI000CDA910B|nr:MULTISPECIES: hypothetical protein [Clostridium]MBN7576228.1 hypothetical protein [Clostridium beijerinckii]MBN7581316.1 hypothetical protein [Clostridium beijerinckii]MBN7585997.1 hypothetical protein [Clostridium beijerinckii]MBO0521936.1 hypothetical protein [Clostridium beijerinckii]POO90027.1 hypothetical protein C1H57_17355 [Clostridium sp. 2-1]